MKGSKSYKGIVMLYIHHRDLPYLRAAAVAESLSLHDFLILSAWKAARNSSKVRVFRPCVPGKRNHYLIKNQETL